MKISYVAATVGMLALLAGCNAPSPSEPNAPAPTNSEDTQKESQQMNATIEVTGTRPDAETDETPSADTGESAERVSAEVALNAPLYKAYSAAERESLHGNEPYVLFFHASWCPVCRKMDSDLNAQLDSFPAGTNILKADYDTEDDLKDEYNVRVQSTVVVLDASGEVVWQGQDPAFDDFKGYIEDSLA